MLTPLDVYLVMQVDTFKTASLISGVVLLIAAPAFLFDLNCESENIKKGLTTGVVACVTFAVLFLTMSVFIPSSQTLGAMYLVPQVVNSKQAQKLDALSLKILDLVDHVADKADKALKEGK